MPGRGAVLAWRAGHESSRRSLRRCRRARVHDDRDASAARPPLGCGWISRCRRPDGRDVWRLDDPDHRSRRDAGGIPDSRLARTASLRDCPAARATKGFAADQLLVDRCWRQRRRPHLRHRQRVDRVARPVIRVLVPVDGCAGRGLCRMGSRRLAPAGARGRLDNRATRTAAAVVTVQVLIDLRWTLRSLRRAPGFTIVFVAVAALGIGATTTAFTLLNHVLIRPLPFPRPDELVALQQTWRAAGDRRTDMAPANLEHWRTMNHSFDAVGGYAVTRAPLTLTGRGEPRRLDAVIVD